MSESKDVDDSFYDRADKHINLANQHCNKIGRGKVSASFMYGLTRFNAWISACNADSANDLTTTKNETIEYFVSQYKAMLEENLDDYILNFDKYMRPPKA